MELRMTYSVKIKRLNRVFANTVRLYRQAVSFLWMYAPQGMGYHFFREKSKKTRKNPTNGPSLRD